MSEQEQVLPVAEPVVAEPVVAEPVVAEPVVAEPVVAEPVVAEPVVAEPVVAEPVHGSIFSYTSNDKLSLTGWAVMYIYDCKCGSQHSADSHGVWPSGDVRTEVVQVACPYDASVINDVELTRP